MSRIRQAVERLRVAAERIPLLDAAYPLSAPRFGPGCCDGELAELDSGFNQGLPADYLEYLSLCRRIEAADVFNGYFLDSPLTVGRVQREDGVPRFLHVDSGPTMQEVLVLSIGSDGGGNLFFMGTSAAGRGQIWKWSHEAEVRSDGMAKDGLTLLAPDFSGFLERMAQDWEHFAEDDRDWQYFSG
jgi:SMI1 / KNR4 family (SUKH-1)